ncbi:DUF6975 family protein [Rhizorhabdus sp. FW153]|uniref:DUF6975 family protein n=1 Tax=Rhizorhabdus sp. FW153 TaxID=3400216 RepID=UPI003CE8F8D5
MAYQVHKEAARPGAAEAVGTLLAADGGKTHPYIASAIFARGREAARDLADAVHLISSLHGGHPGVVDLAQQRPPEETVRAWLDAAAEGFAQERAYLMRTVVAAGPLPSTPGHAGCETAVAGQRHALEMLARSERKGCALGAAAALVLDWRAIRTVVDAAAQRFGVTLTPPALPSMRQTLGVLELIESPAAERAIVFGAQQLLIQHRGLWDLLEARSGARVEALL